MPKTLIQNNPLCDDNLSFQPGDPVFVASVRGGRGGNGKLKLVRGFGELAIAEVTREEDGILLCVPISTISTSALATAKT